MLDRTTL
jgi:hypothetical protein